MPTRPRSAFAECKAVVLVLSIAMMDTGLALEDDEKPSTRDRFIALDSEIQAVKQEALEINQEILLLEEQLLYPPGEQLLVFLSLSGNGLINVNSISLELDGKPVSQHVYTSGEKAALRKGGAHRLYTGRVPDGAHVVHVSLSGMGAGGRQFDGRQSVKIIKGSDRKIMELNISAGKNGSEPQLTIHEW